MNVSQTVALCVATIALLGVNSLSVCGQTASSAGQPSGIAVSLAIDKDQMPKVPWAILTVKNLTDHEVVINDTMYQVHADGDKSEAPTRQHSKWKRRPNSGEAQGLRGLFGDL